MTTSNTSAELYPMFINNSGLPINVETWQYTKNSSLESLNQILVKQGEKIILPSINGEWYLQTYLKKEQAEEWRNAGFIPGEQIGKFRNKPCASGNYSWMSHYDSPFKIVYDPKNSTATFIKNK